MREPKSSVILFAAVTGRWLSVVPHSLMLRMAWPEEAEPIFVSFRGRQLGRSDEEKIFECVLSVRVSCASRGLKRSDELRQNARAIGQKCPNRKSVTFVVFRRRSPRQRSLPPEGGSLQRHVRGYGSTHLVTYPLVPDPVSRSDPQSLDRARASLGLRHETHPSRRHGRVLRVGRAARRPVAARAAGRRRRSPGRSRRRRRGQLRSARVRRALRDPDVARRAPVPVARHRAARISRATRRRRSRSSRSSAR